MREAVILRGRSCQGTSDGMASDRLWDGPSCPVACGRGLARVTIPKSVCTSAVTSLFEGGRFKRGDRGEGFPSYQRLSVALSSLLPQALSPSFGAILIE